MFIENCAKIRGKLAGNWRHLQNKGEDGEEVVWGVMKEEIELASTHVFVVGGLLKRGDLVCRENNFCPLLRGRDPDAAKRC